MTKTVTWTEIATKYLALLDSNINTDKANISKKGIKFSSPKVPKKEFVVTTVIINGKTYDIRNFGGFGLC